MLKPKAKNVNTDQEIIKKMIIAYFVGKWSGPNDTGKYKEKQYTQQNSYSISHPLGTVTTLWLDSDFSDCWQLPAAWWLHCHLKLSHHAASS